MRRLIAPCVCALALITGAWLGQAYTLIAPLDPIGEETALSQRVAPIVWRFYDAIDLLFRTGDDAALRDVVDPGFVDHVDTPGSLGNRDGLFGYLAALRTTHPMLRLVPADVTSQGDRAIAEITLTGDADGSILGIPLAGSLPWPKTELFRIEGDRIAERWGGQVGHASFSLLFSGGMTAPSRGTAYPSLRRVTVAPGVSGAVLDRRDPAIISVESGELTIGASDARGPSSPASVRMLGPGSALVITEKMDIALSNRTDAQAVFLLLSLAQPTHSPTPGLDTSLMDTDDGVAVRSLAGNGTVGVLLSTDELTAEMATVTLAPGMRLSPHAVGAAEFVVVEAGTLTATVTGDTVTAWLRDPGGHATSADSFAEVFQGFGLSVSGAGASTSYRNESSEPVTFLLVTLSPR